MRVRCLTVHAGYRCQHSGECCSGVFAIPAEPRVLELTRQPAETWGQISIFGRNGNLRSDPSSAAGGQISILPENRKLRSDPGDGGVATHGGVRFLPTATDGACVFYERHSRLCGLHTLHGADVLPTACRHFPRVFLRDGRGTAMSLSHFCPTAAGLLFEDVPLQVVDTELPPELAGNLEAFDAVEALPPLLRPGLLSDLDGFDAWERDAVELLARADLGHVEALDRIAAATEIVRRWKPTAGPLRTCVADAFRRAGRRSEVRYELDENARLDLVNASGLASAGCGLERPPDFEEAWDRYVAAIWAGLDRPVARYLAAKLFGHRIAYECRGLRSLVEWLRVVLAVLRNEAIRIVSGARDVLTGERFLEAVRAADLALVHRLDTAALARGLAAVEGQP